MDRSKLKEPLRSSVDVDGLWAAWQLLSMNRVVGLFILEQLHLRLPAWLVEKLQLFPSKQLSRKLSNLWYQLDQVMTGVACDLEDRYLALGIPEADLTYQDEKGYYVCDATTSQDINLQAEKRARLAMSAMKAKVRSMVVVIPVTHEFVYNKEDRPGVDTLDKFNKLLLSASPYDQTHFSNLLARRVAPKVDKMILKAMVDYSVDPTQNLISGNLRYDLKVQPSVWKDEDQALLHHMQPNLAMVLSADLKDGVTVPFVKERLSQPSSRRKHTDPIVQLMEILATDTTLVGDVAYKLSGSLIISVLTADAKETHSMFRYHGKGATRAQRDAMNDPDGQVIYFCLSTDAIVSSSGLRMPKAFSLAVGRDWAGYGADHIKRGFDDSGNTGLLSSKAAPVDIATVQMAQDKHDCLVRFLSSKHEGVEATLKKKVELGARLTQGLEWNSMLLGAIQTKDKVSPVDTKLFALLSQQYEIARVISSVLSEKHSSFRYRVCFTSGSSLALAVGTGNSISRMRDVPVSFWSQSPLNFSETPRARLRTISVSSRLLGWWVRLPFVYLSRTTCAVQHNLPLPPNHALSDTLESVTEHIVMHLKTRQQESLLQDQTRYVLAGLYSYDPEPVGPLSKAKGVLLRTPSSVVYWARLCRLQSIAYLTKAGMRPGLELSAGSPPLIVPPQHSTILSTHGIFVDAMFDSKLFNKDQDDKVPSQALDWKSLLETEIKFKKAVKADELLELGLSPEAHALICGAISSNSLQPVIADLQSPSSIWAQSATDWWLSKVGKAGSIDFSWNACAFYALACRRFAGQRWSSRVEDYHGIFADLGAQSLTSFLTSSGSTAKGPATAARQSVRKSTAMLGFLVDSLASEDVPYPEAGTWLHRHALKNPNQYQSLLTSGLTITRFNGNSRLVSRTETKEQSGGGREFSAMNAVGIVACRYTERIFAQYLRTMSTDRMTDPHAEATLYEKVKQHTDTRRLSIAADNSRFGPNQVMAKSRALIAVLCMADKAADYHPDTMLVLYDTTAESTRLMNTKVSKMPHDLHEFLRDAGGLSKVFKHNPDSTLGQVAGLMLNEMGWLSVQPGFVQRWGMYQGALGMLSSCASSMLHDVFVHVITKSGLVAKAEAMVTNDDSAIFVSGIPASTPLAYASVQLKVALKFTLGIGGQVLNMFKTVVSSFLNEFHSTFATSAGLVCPELKFMCASLAPGRGENMSDDAALPVEAGISALRQGVSLYNSTSLAVFNSILFCDQYNRWPAIKKHGPRPLALGGPVLIDLIKELVLPGYGNLSLYAPAVHRLGALAVSSAIVEGMVEETEDGLLSLEKAGTAMVTRRLHKQARGVKELQWTNPRLALPLVSRPALAPLVTSVSVGVLRNDEELGQERLLVRMGRNAVSRTNANIKVPKSGWISKSLGKAMISYDDLDSVGVGALTSTKVPEEALSKHTLFVTTFSHWLEAAKAAVALPSTTKLLLSRPGIKQEDMVVCPIRVTEDHRLPSTWSMETAITQWGSTALKQEFVFNKNLNFDPGRYTPDLDLEVRSVTATSIAFNKLSKQRTGPFMVAGDNKGKYDSTETALLCTRQVFRGLSTVVPTMADLLAVIADTMAPPPELIELNQQISFRQHVDFLSKGKFAEGTALLEGDDDLCDLLSLADKGWFDTTTGRSKVKRLGRPVRRYGRMQWDNAYLVTVHTDSYRHLLYGVKANDSLMSFEGWPEYLQERLPRDWEYLDPIRLSHKDELVVVNSLSVNSVAFKVEYNAVVCVTPLVSFGIKHIKPELKDTTLPEPHPECSKADLAVWISGGKLRYSDYQVTRMVEEDRINVARLIKQYRTGELYSDAKLGVFRRPVELKHEAQWLKAAAAVKAHGFNTMEGYAPMQERWDVDVAEDEDHKWVERSDEEEDSGEDAEEEFNRTLREMALTAARQLMEDDNVFLKGEVVSQAQFLEDGKRAFLAMLDEETSALLVSIDEETNALTYRDNPM